MEKCKYCNTTMISENETLKDKSYKFFSTCPNCKSIYEGIKDKDNTVLKSRWWNNKTKNFEDIKRY
jgi:Zn finger protein HypA/HybF involved in hydrogenase expression